MCSLLIDYAHEFTAAHVHHGLQCCRFSKLAFELGVRSCACESYMGASLREIFLKETPRFFFAALIELRVF